MEKLFKVMKMDKLKEFTYYWFAYRYGELEKYEEVVKLNKASIIEELVNDITWSEFTINNVKAMLQDMSEEDFQENYYYFMGGK